MVISGSLPPGVPEDFYVRVADIARSQGAKVAVDTSAAPFRRLLEAGVYLAKPNRRELQEWAGIPLDDLDSQILAARKLVASGHARNRRAYAGPRGRPAGDPRPGAAGVRAAGDAGQHGRGGRQLPRRDDRAAAPRRHAGERVPLPASPPARPPCSPRGRTSSHPADVERILPQVRVERLPGEPLIASAA